MNCYSFLGHEYSFVNTIVSCLTTLKRLKSQKKIGPLMPESPSGLSQRCLAAKAIFLQTLAFLTQLDHEIVCLQNAFF